MTIRVAAVGCGAIAHEHLAHLRSASGVHLVAVCDASRAAAEFARQRYGPAAAFTNLDEMLRTSEPRVVHVLTPPQHHPDAIERCLAAGAHVICEKPIAPSAADLEGLVATAERRGLRLMESQNLRFNGPILEIDRALARGQIGEIREIDLLLTIDFASSRFADPNLSGPAVHLPGGVVQDYLPHLAYLLLHFAGRAPDSILGHLRSTSGIRRLGFDELDALVSCGRVRGRLRIAWDLAGEGFRVVVRGTNSTIETDLYHPYLRSERAAGSPTRMALSRMASGLNFAASSLNSLFNKALGHGAYDGLGSMLNAFYRALEEDRPPPISTADMLASAHLIDALVDLREARWRS